ncbi:MAG: S-layer homology domain-containing protein [Chloroflexota bacterium]
MKRRFSIVVAAFGLLMLVPLVVAEPGSAALPTGSAVELRPVETGTEAGYRNPFLPMVDFILDDGGMEYQFGINTSGHGLVLLGLNRFTLSAGQYPLLLNEISVLFPDLAHANIDLTGRNVDLLVYRDTSGSGQPVNANKIYQSTVQIQTVSPNFSVYPVSIPVQGPGDIYVGFSNTYDHGGGVLYSYPYGIDQGQSQQRSWIIGNYNGSDPNYNDLSNNQLVSLLDDMGMAYIGNFLIRAKGEVGGTPNPTPTRTRTPTPGPTVTRPPAYVLYDQYDHISPIYATNSQQYEPFMQAYTDYLADDFVVPAGQTWYLDEVDVAGRIEAGMGPVESFNVIVYTSGGTVPGSPVYTSTNVPYTLQGAGEYRLPLVTPPVLAAGTYWMMVQGNLAYSTAGQFMWYNRALQSHNAAAWYNPGDAYQTVCTELWNTRWMCTGDASEADQVYRLLGTSTGGATPMATSTAIQTPTAPAATNTPAGTGTVPVATVTANATHTPTVMAVTGTTTPSGTPTAPPTACALQFTDVLPGSTFYPFVRCLTCRGIVNGYPDNTFRPNNSVTRGQLSKTVANAAGYSEPAGAQLFEDVAPGSTFYDFVQRLASRGYISGYLCGGPVEPCGVGSLAYFRPNNNATRGQISKIVSNAAGLNDPAGVQIFEDVAPGSTFYDFVFRLASRGYMNGYPCGGPDEPCSTGNMPYFRPNANATRGQTSKIVGNAFFPGCDTPGR